MKNISGFSAKAVLLTASLMVLASCNDTWNDHYSYKNDSNYPVEKIDVTLKGIEGYKNFYKTLAIHFHRLFNSHQLQYCRCDIT